MTPSKTVMDSNEQTNNRVGKSKQPSDAINAEELNLLCRKRAFEIDCDALSRSRRATTHDVLAKNVGKSECVFCQDRVASRTVVAQGPADTYVPVTTVINFRSGENDGKV